ncbi:MAG: preprotein translocase subunit SecE [Candidatus Obscuribacterales bacterium]|nr:preprotein translocase subunit SecE [Candidatus Obscuribacterales bacterium]
MSTEGADPTQRKVELSAGGEGNGDDKPGADASEDETRVSNTTVKSERPEGGAAARAAQTESASKGAGLLRFLAETVVELRKISWPDRQQVIRETASVILLVCLITVAVLCFDWAVAKAVFEPLDHFARSVGGGVGSQH